MKKIIITSAIIATILTIASIAIYDLEIALTIFLSIVLIGLIALTIGSIWNGIVEVKAEIKRRREMKRKQNKGV